MKKVSNKLQSLVNRMYKIQEELDELRNGLDYKRGEFEDEDEDRYERKISKIDEDIEYIDDAYYALDSAISELENYIE